MKECSFYDGLQHNVKIHGFFKMSLLEIRPDLQWMKQWALAIFSSIPHKVTGHLMIIMEVIIVRS